MEPEQAKAPAIPWRWWSGMLWVLLMFFMSQALALALLTAVLSVVSMSTGESFARLANSTTDSVGWNFLYLLFAQIISIAAVWFFVKRYKNGLKLIGLRRPKWSDLGWGVVVLIMYMITLAVVVALLDALVPGFNADQKQNVGPENLVYSWQYIATFVGIVILPPIAEELMVRGLLYSSLRKILSVVWAALAVSFMFAVAHLFASQDGGLLFVAGVDTFILSLFLVGLREKTGGLWAGIATHALKNSLAFVLVFVLKVT